MITCANRDGLLTRVPTSKRGPEISHLFFADESLLFCRSNIAQWNHLSSILHAYEVASGQKMNNNKTTIFFSRNTTTKDRKQIQEIAGIPTNQCYDTFGAARFGGTVTYKGFQKYQGKSVETSPGLEAQILVSSGERNIVKGCGLGDPYLLYECFQAT